MTHAAAVGAAGGVGRLGGAFMKTRALYPRIVGDSATGPNAGGLWLKEVERRRRRRWRCRSLP